LLAQVFFFIIGFLCGHFCRKERHNTTSQTSTGPGTAGQHNQENTPSTPLYEDVMLNQREQDLELKENVAYAPIITMVVTDDEVASN
jgi:hypothetical protein